MYKTTGIIDRTFYESIKYHAYPKKGSHFLKICITVLTICYLLFAFWMKDFEFACITMITFSLYTVLFWYIGKKYVKINLRRMQESFHTDSMDMSTEFTEEGMVISSSIRQEPTCIYYENVSRVVVTSKYYLIFTKAEQLICVFAEQLPRKDQLELLHFLKGKVPKLKVYRENKIRKYLTVLIFILLYLSFAVFLIRYFQVTDEVSVNTDSELSAEMEEAEFQPELDDETDETEPEQFQSRELTYQIENPSWEYYCSDRMKEAEIVPIDLELVYEVENNITDLNVWLASNEITVPQFPYSDESYFYTFTGDLFYEATGLMISGENHSYHIDMNSFTMKPDKVYEANDPFMTNHRGYVNFAKIKDGILYVSTGHKGYTTDNPSTGYITAINLENGEVLWKSAPQVSNAYNFEIVGDVIICGYGFTDEKDSLYLLNRATGQVIEKIPLKSMAEYIVAKDSTLYVRTYNRNYEFSYEKHCSR